MRISRLLLLTCVATGIHMNATTIGFATTDLGLNSSGQTVYEYTYTVSGLILQANQELDFYYSPTVYNALSNPVAPSSLQPLVLQPNNPPGTSGDFSLFSSADNTVVTGPLSIDFTLLGSASPSPQPYDILQYPANGKQPFVIASGETTPTAVTTPEPAAAALTAVSLLLGFLGWGVRCYSMRARC